MRGNKNLPSSVASLIVGWSDIIYSNAIVVVWMTERRLSNRHYNDENSSMRAYVFAKVIYILQHALCLTG